MDHKQRHRRLRQLVAKLNKERKSQAKKIDILCNDIIGAQRNFIKTLNNISFAANFYESIVGITDLSSLFYAADKLIKDELNDINVAFFLRQEKSFELHMLESNQPITLEKHMLENCFTAELVNNICEANKQCSLEDIIAMGLQGNPAMLSKISAFTIPLGRGGTSVGFILLRRSSGQNITCAELDHISAITAGLSRSISFCRIYSH
jgi:hypothetical protein